MGILQYELDIRVTALAMYEGSINNNENEKDELKENIEANLG